MRPADHYQTLGILPSASIQEVKKAYRKLALRFHPDRNPGDDDAENRFKEIQQAYAIIGSPEKRRAYDERSWLSPGISPKAGTALTPLSILKDAIRLRQYVSLVNIYSIDQDALSYHMQRTLTPAKLDILLSENNDKLNQQVIKELIVASEVLKYRYLENIIPLLRTLAQKEKVSQLLIETYLKKRKRSSKQDKFFPLAILIIVAILCWLIYRYGK